MLIPAVILLQGGKWVAQRDTVKVVRDTVKVVRDGQMKTVKPDETDYIVPTATEMYSEVTNLVPFLSSNSGGRAILGTIQMVQAVPLKDPEIPSVRANNSESAKAFNLGMVSPFAGRVLRVTKDYIRVKRAKLGTVKTVPIYNNLPLNRGAFLDAKPFVKVGDKVKKNQVLADSNMSTLGRLSVYLDSSTKNCTQTAFLTCLPFHHLIP